jgi:GT2 family glycosyltransferase
MRPLLSLVVLGFRNFEATTRVCLESLVPCFTDPEVEVIVVDNGSNSGSDDDSTQRTAAWCVDHPPVRFIASDSNLGFAGGMNLGVASAQGAWVVLVNNDTIFSEGAVDAFKRVVLAADHHIAMLGPITNAAGNGQRLWKPGASHAQWLDIGKWLNANPTGELMPAYRCDFFCIAIRTKVWKELGGLDRAFGLGYYEDFDFSLRLAAAGYQQMITEDVFVLHLGSATFKASAAATALMKRNKKLLKAKHPHARFEHTRLGNLAILQRYQKLKSEGRWSPALQVRYDLRVGALTGDAPRSMLKRWLWNQRISRFQISILSQTYA